MHYILLIISCQESFEISYQERSQKYAIKAGNLGANYSSDNIRREIFPGVWQFLQYFFTVLHLFFILTQLLAKTNFEKEHKNRLKTGLIVQNKFYLQRESSFLKPR